MTSPNAPALPLDRARAALLGWNPSSAAIAAMRSRVAADTPGCPLSANDTAAVVTPARLATSLMVGRFTSVSLLARRLFPPRQLPGSVPILGHRSPLALPAARGGEE